MKDTSIRSFDIPTLLRLGDLNIREVAQDNLTLSVGKYYAMLSEFLAGAPKAASALERIAALTARQSDLEVVIDIKAQMENIGCEKLIFILSDIIGAVEKNNLEFAATCAKSILDDFYEIPPRITLAERSGKAANVLPPHDPTIESTPIAAQPLKNVLNRLDRDELTRKLRILAVDDSAVMLKTISSILSGKYEVHGMTNPMKLEKFLQQIVPELFLLDFKMPERSGFELIPIIRNFEEHKTTPIIILTSMGTVDHISASHSLGACDFIVKPVEDTVLHEKVAKHIVRKKLF